MLEVKMNRRFPIVFLSTLILLLILVAVSSAEPSATPLPVANVDGTWSNPDSGSSIGCLATENSPGDETNENKIHAGTVNGEGNDCYTDAPWNAAPYNGGAGYSEGSGFGFDGSNGLLNVEPNTPFLLGLLTHYNRRIGSNSGISGADLTVAIEVTGATPETTEFIYDVLLDETPNNPSGNTDDTCPYPLGSFYSAEYLAFNGGYSAVIETFGTPFDHQEINSDEPPDGTRSDNWLCGDRIVATLTSPSDTAITFDGIDYTLTILGNSYPAQNVALNELNDIPADVCGEFDDVDDLATLGLESKELQATQGCIWAEFTAEPTAVTLSATPQATQPAFPIQTLLIILILSGFILSGLFIRRRSLK